MKNFANKWVYQIISALYCLVDRKLETNSGITMALPSFPC